MNNAATVRREATGDRLERRQRTQTRTVRKGTDFVLSRYRFEDTCTAPDEVMAFPLFLQEATEQPQRTINVPDLDNLAPRHLGHTSSIVGGADD